MAAIVATRIFFTLISGVIAKLSHRYTVIERQTSTFLQTKKRALYLECSSLSPIEKCRYLYVGYGLGTSVAVYANGRYFVPLAITFEPCIVVHIARCGYSDSTRHCRAPFTSASRVTLMFAAVG